MTQDGEAPRPLVRQDAEALIGVAAVLEGHLVAGDLDPHVVGSLNRHLHGAGLVAADAGPPELRVALTNLNHRLRYSLGEYDRPPPPDTGQVDQHFGFPTEAAARAFTSAASTQGEHATSPEPVDGRAYDGELRWQVDVRSSELPLSSAFDQHVRRLRALAGEHHGDYCGWGGVPPVGS